MVGQVWHQAQFACNQDQLAECAESRSSCQGVEVRTSAGLRSVPGSRVGTSVLGSVIAKTEQQRAQAR